VGWGAGGATAGCLTATLAAFGSAFHFVPMSKPARKSMTPTKAKPANTKEIVFLLNEKS
jgi:hypothetical protein